MKKFSILFMGILFGAILTVMILWNGLASEARAQSGNATPESVNSISDEGAAQPQQFTGPGDETMPAEFAMAPQSPGVLPTPVPGNTTLYFVPTDNDATATVLYLYNTSNAAQIVPLRGFSYNGVLVYSLNINVGANSFLRLASDFDRVRPAAQLGDACAGHHQFHRFHLLRQSVPAARG